MKALLFIILFLLSVNTLKAQEIIVLRPSQSMCITGKGPGQDGAINPYINKDSFAVVENIGSNDFVARIQKNGKIIETIPIKTNEKQKILLLKGQELYFDTEKETKVKVDFEAKLD